MIVLAAVPVILLTGGAWIAPKILDYLAWPVAIAFLFCLIVFLPLSLFRKTRSLSSVGFLISSYIFGASAWFAGLLASYIYCGAFWTVLALFAFGVGVVPLGIIGALVHTDWMAAGLLFGGLVLTYGARAIYSKRLDYGSIATGFANSWREMMAAPPRAKATPPKQT